MYARSVQKGHTRVDFRSLGPIAFKNFKKCWDSGASLIMERIRIDVCIRKESGNTCLHFFVDRQWACARQVGINGCYRSKPELQVLIL